MPDPRDVAFGRMALERGWVHPEHLRQVHARLAPGQPLRDALLEAQLLTPQQAGWIDAHLGGDDAVTLTAGPAEDAVATLAPGAGVAAQAPGARAPGSRSGSVALPEPGVVVEGRYQLQAILGRGGMGAVYRARDLSSGEDVALKVMLPDASRSGSALARFQREAEAVAKVDAHAGIVRVRACGRHGGVLPYAVMDLVEGEDLRSRVKRHGPLPVDEALRLTEAVGRAMEHCHRKGVLHRDLKSANVLLRLADGTPHVTDFGLALDTAEERLTRTGEVMGTPAYMSPEQAEGTESDVDHRTDVYALGAILHELLTGEPPFTGGQMQIIKKVFLDMPPAVTSLRADAPPEVDAICHMAMAKDRTARYASAAAFADDLAALRAGDPVAASPPGRRALFTWRLRRRDGRAWGTLLAVFLAGLLAVTAPVALYLNATRVSPAEALELRLGELPRVLASGDVLGREREVDETAQVTGQLALLETIAELGWSLDGGDEGASAPSPHAPRVRAAIDAARAGEGGGPFAQVLRRQGPDVLLLLDRLVVRVGFGEEVAWQGSEELLEVEGAETELLKALRLLRWGRNRLQTGATPRRGDKVEPVTTISGDLPGADDLQEAEALLRSVSDAPGPVGAAAKDVLKVRGEVNSFLDQALQENRLAGRESGLELWRELCERVGDRARAMLVPLLAELKPAALLAAAERETDSKASGTLGEAVLGLVRFADWVVPVDGQPALWERIRRGMQAQGTLRSDRLGAFLQDVLGQVALYLDWSRMGDLQRKIEVDLTYGFFDLLPKYQMGQASAEDVLQLLLVYPYVGVLPVTGQSEALLERFDKDGVWDRLLPRLRQGNAYLMWARGSEELCDTKQRQDPVVLRRLAGRYALALGDALSDAEWEALHVGPRPELPSGVEPLGEMWVPLALHWLALIAMERYHDPAHRLERVLAAAALNRRMWTERERLLVEDRVPAMRYAVMKSRKVRLELRKAVDEPGVSDARRAELEQLRAETLELEQAMIEHGIEVGWRHLADQQRAAARPGDSTQSLLRIDLPEDNARRVIQLVYFRAENMADEGREDDALAQLNAAEQKLGALGLTDVSGVVDKRAHLLLKLGRLDETEAEAKRLIELGKELLETGGLSEDNRAVACQSKGTCLLAHVAFERGDVEGARAIYEANQGKKRSGDWDELELKLGIRKP